MWHALLMGVQYDDQTRYNNRSDTLHADILGVAGEGVALVALDLVHGLHLVLGGVVDGLAEGGRCGAGHADQGV
ncbi:MAG: hypothetical protein EBR58_13850, partial [Betaproteobacteria bacterium]|nr:hypothetical protein [Betaproteobacteria bacterium]